MPERIPVVCCGCGKEGGFDLCGSVEVTVEVWRHVKVCGWDPSKNGLAVELGLRETAPDVLWDVEDDVELDRYCCSHCGKCADSLDDLAAPKYGVNQWGQILDESGRAFGPMVVHPDQLKLEVAA